MPRAERPSVPCPAGTLVIGDLHLDLFDGAHGEPFACWLEALGDVPRLIVLGDLFEFWVGRHQGRVEGARRVLAALRALVDRGTPVDVLYGNRDFLMGAHFVRASACTLRPQGLVGELEDGSRTLFLHGDELCTLDLSYQRFKRVMRSRPGRWLAACLPLSLQRSAAARLRRASAQAAARPEADEKRALQASAAVRQAAEQGARQLVCGHAHEFRDDPLPGGGRWLVIDAWGGERDALRMAADGVWEPLRASALVGSSVEGEGGPTSSVAAD